MKIAIIISGQVKRVPHIQIFINALNLLNADFDIICWNREEHVDKEGFVYQYQLPNGSPFIIKAWAYFKFSKYVQNTIRKNHYDKLIIVGSQIGMYLYGFLKRRSFSKNIWLDFRDLSIEQKFMGRFKKFMNLCEYITLSSPGFKKALPPDYDFIISHNFNIDVVKKVLSHNSDNNYTSIKRPVIISTIGYLRDTQENIALIEGLKNNNNFQLRFIGEGPAVSILKMLVKENGIYNVIFAGRYEMEDEHVFYEQTDIINILMPDNLMCSTLLSNRIYNALIYKKPVIVTIGSYQSEYVEKNKLGISVSDYSNLSSNIEKYLEVFDADIFFTQCNSLLQDCVEDYTIFFETLKKFITK